MFGMIRTLRTRSLESRARKLEARRDAIIAALCSESTQLYRHQYPDTPMLEDICLELDYVRDALRGMPAAALAQPAN